MAEETGRERQTTRKVSSVCGLWSAGAVLLSAYLLFPCLEMLIQGTFPRRAVSCKALSICAFMCVMQSTLYCSHDPVSAVCLSREYVGHSVFPGYAQTNSPKVVSNGPEELLLNCTVPFMLVWKDSIMLCSLGRQPIFWRPLNRPSLLIKSNALVGSMKAMNMGICCSLHFSWIWRKEKPNCDSASFCRRIKRNRAKI